MFYLSPYGYHRMSPNQFARQFGPLDSAVDLEAHFRLLSPSVLAGIVLNYSLFLEKGKGELYSLLRCHKGDFNQYSSAGSVALNGMEDLPPQSLKVCDQMFGNPYSLL